MDKQTEKTLIELIQFCGLCSNHKVSPDSYTAPAFLNFLNTPLTIEHIPMESWNIQNNGEFTELTENPKNVPWEDSIKNFVLDLTSIKTTKKSLSCIILTEFGYNYPIATIHLLTKKYADNGASIVYVTPENDTSSSFRVTVRCDSKIESDQSIASCYLIEQLFIWHAPHNTLIFCHDSSIAQYRDFLNMASESIWSVSCTPSSFVETYDTPNTCEYICPVYSHPASQETRAVGSGKIKFTESKITRMYLGRINYYLRCIRGSKHSSGRCYDCEVLYSLVVSLDYYRPKSTSSPIINFDPTFLLYAREKSQQTV